MRKRLSLLILLSNLCFRTFLSRKTQWHQSSRRVNEINEFPKNIPSSRNSRQQFGILDPKFRSVPSVRRKRFPTSFSARYNVVYRAVLRIAGSQRNCHVARSKQCSTKTGIERWRLAEIQFLPFSPRDVAEEKFYGRIRRVVISQLPRFARAFCNRRPLANKRCSLRRRVQLLRWFRTRALALSKRFPAEVWARVGRVRALWSRYGGLSRVIRLILPPSDVARE